jgi:putative YphP/YqiW family bacilliredoxin
MFKELNIASSRSPIYNQEAVQPMRDELTWVGFEELLTPEQVDDAVQNTKGSMFVLINSVCGCAAGSARPGTAAALQHSVIPDRLATVFAGQERDAVNRMREHIGQPPSSPSMAMFVDGELKAFVPRQWIEGRRPEEITGMLTEVFDELCTRRGPSVSREKYEQLVHAKMCGSKIPRNEAV